MAATEVFAMSNPNNTCTAAALTWVYMRLSGRTTPRAELFSGSDPTLKRNINLIGDYDDDVDSQVGMMGFDPVKKQDGGNISSLQIAELEYIDVDEYVEATPKNLRLRKKILDDSQRKRSEKSRAIKFVE